MTSVSLAADEVVVVRLVLSLFLHSLLNGEEIRLDTLLSAFETAGVPKDENPLAHVQPKVLKTLLEKFRDGQGQDQDAPGRGAEPGTAGPGAADEGVRHGGVPERPVRPPSG
jgi:hypothetical protein